MNPNLKKANYKGGAIKRKMKITAQEKVNPGDLITRMNEQKRSFQNKPTESTSKTNKTTLAIKGLV